MTIHWRYGRDRRSVARALAAFFISLALVALASGTAHAVASRTSDGLALPTPTPRASAGQSPAPVLPTTPAATARSAAGLDDWLTVALGLVAAAGFGGGLWLLLRAPPSRRRRASRGTRA